MTTTLIILAALGPWLLLAGYLLFTPESDR